MAATRAGENLVSGGHGATCRIAATIRRDAFASDRHRGHGSLLQWRDAASPFASQRAPDSRLR